MENTAATGLPEADSLPDGFVDSTADPLCPPTPKFEQEKPLVDYSASSVSDVVDINESILESTATESQSRTEKTQKPRNFPVPLSAGENLNASLDLVDEDDKGYKDHCFDAAKSATPEFVELDSETLGKLAGCTEEKEQAQGKLQSSERPSDGSSNVLHMKEIPLSETDLLKNKKLGTSETKRKNVKRSFKSEKEFLELTLSYQQVLAERDTAISVRDRLESLCRELQRQNKMLMDECKRVSTEGQNLRLDLSNKFQDAIKEVSIKLDQQKDECISSLKENEMLKVKLKALENQYVLAEKHHEQELKQKNLELQIAELKTKQHEERVVHEQSQMKVYAEQVSQLLSTEKNLRLQLTADGEKFQQFQDALLKSNEVFETFKQEIEKMAKSIKDLKKENTFLKSKCEKTDVTLIQLVEERERMKKQIEKLKKKKEKLESLCRTLQAERRHNSLGSSSSSSTSDSAPTV